LMRGPQADAIVRRTGPLPTPLDETEAGLNTEAPREPATAGSPFAPQMTRLRSRALQSEVEGARERFAPERAPQWEDSPSDRNVAVRESLPVDVPRIAPAELNVARPNFAAVRTRETATVPSTYRLRSIEKRLETARQFGGTEDSEKAVEASLQWLADRQEPDGRWDADRFGSGQVEIDEQGVNRQFAGKEADTGITALAMLAFLGAGYTHEEGQYAATVNKAIDWLIAQQRTDGYLGGKAEHHAQMYCHGMATYALAEAYAMQSDLTTDTRLREPLRKAVAYILSQQNPQDGGWRYIKGQKGDMSIFGWQLMALKSAEIAGIAIPQATREKMQQFLQSASLGHHGGLAGYKSGSPVSEVMTAEALFCKQMLGLVERSGPQSREAVSHLLEHKPKLSELNLYYWYYGTLAMYQYGGRSWRQWNESVRELLIEEQEQDGELAGSWDPRGPWGAYGGRIYSTALATLCLEVYYRFLPLYQTGGRYEGED
ncbi:MAG: hypothetical protein ACREJB_15275, partial [Planctomycetaceae bacterium]